MPDNNMTKRLINSIINIKKQQFRDPFKKTVLKLDLFFKSFHIKFFIKKLFRWWWDV